MEKIGNLIRAPGESPPASNQLRSDYHIGGKSIQWTQQETEAFWKKEFVACFKQEEPLFVIDDRNRALVAAVYEWVWGHSTVFDSTKGLLLWGPLGVGKSLILKALRRYEGRINRLCFGCNNDRFGFYLASATEISLQYAEKGIEGISKYTDRARMSNLAIDELGREPLGSKHFGTGVNVIQTVLQLRYENRQNAITHITTNLNPDTEFAAKYDYYIADRVKEMFNVIEMKGKSRR